MATCVIEVQSDVNRCKRQLEGPRDSLCYRLPMCRPELPVRVKYSVVAEHLTSLLPLIIRPTVVRAALRKKTHKFLSLNRLI